MSRNSPIQMGETDIDGYTLIVGGRNADFLVSPDGYAVRDANLKIVIEKVTWNEASTKYDELNGGHLSNLFKKSWFEWYSKLNKNPRTGTRLGKSHPAYRQNLVSEWVKKHPEEVAKIKEKHENQNNHSSV